MHLICTPNHKSIGGRPISRTRKTPVTPKSKQPDVGNLLAEAQNALEDKKAQNLTHINLEGKSSMADDLLIATGTSRTHVLALAAHVQEALKKAGAPMVSTEGEEDAQWVLVDGGDIIVHVFQAEVREHYRLERLWAHHFDVDDDNELEEDLATHAG